MGLGGGWWRLRKGCGFVLDILIKKENHRLAVENSLTTIGIIKNKIKQGAFDIKGDVLET